MKKIGILILGICILTSCGNAKNKKDQKTMVGNDKDKHGCIASAGYTWSTIKQDCIKVFEIGQQLNSVDEKAISSAFLVFNEDRSKFELFLPTTKETTILTLNKEGKYTADNYIFDVDNLSLSINGAEKYKAEK